MSGGPLLVWGAGAIGGTIGAHLVRAGHEVLFVDRAADHVEAMGARGLAIAGPIAEFTVPARAFLPERLEGRFARVLLCVKAQDTREAAERIAPHLAEDGYVVSAQNGLNELVIAEILGPSRTIGCFVNFGADYIAPGTIHYAGRGAVVLGEIDGAQSERVRALHRLFLAFDERAVLTGNIWGYLWSKLAYGALLFATALTDASIADCLASRPHRPLFVALAREVVATAEANGVALEAFDGFAPASFRSAAAPSATGRSLDDLVAFNRRSAKTHSGIWRDLAVRKRRTEADAQLGPIVRLARERGRDAPLTARLIELVKSIEDGRAAQGWALLDRLAEAMPQEAAG